jgi:hypothetical protein
MSHLYPNTKWGEMCISMCRKSGGEDQDQPGLERTE